MIEKILKWLNRGKYLIAAGGEAKTAIAEAINFGDRILDIGHLLSDGKLTPEEALRLAKMIEKAGEDVYDAGKEVATWLNSYARNESGNP